MCNQLISWNPISEKIILLNVSSNPIANSINTENRIIFNSSAVSSVDINSNRTKVLYNTSHINCYDFYNEKYKKKLREYGGQRSLRMHNRSLESINNYSQVVGFIEFTITGVTGFFIHGFIFDNGLITDLGKGVCPNDIQLVCLY